MPEPVVMEGVLEIWSQEGGNADPGIDLLGTEDPRVTMAGLIVEHIGVGERKQHSCDRHTGPVRITAEPGRIVIERIDDIPLQEGDE